MALLCTLEGMEIINPMNNVNKEYTNSRELINKLKNEHTQQEHTFSI